MGRSVLRGTAVVGALGLGLLAMSSAVAATDNQAGATALYLAIAGNGQSSGNVTATYENGKETRTGNTKPPISAPANGYLQGGVLAQEATAQPGISTACAGLAGDGGSAVNIGDSSCLAPDNLVTGSLTDLSLGDLIGEGAPDLSTIPGLGDLLGQLPSLPNQPADPTKDVTDAIDAALKQVTDQFGDGGLIANLDLIEGRCTAGDGGPTGTSTLANAKIQLVTPAKTITLVTLPLNPPKNTHLVTDLSVVLNTILSALDTQLKEGIDGALGPATEATAAIRDNIVKAIHDQVEDNLKPLEDNVLDVVLNEQENPTPESIKVRALHAKVLPAAEEQLGASLVDLQIGTATCAPVARDAIVSPPQADTPQVANPATPTGVSSGVAGTADGGLDASTWALLALGSLGMIGAGLVGARRLLG